MDSLITISQNNVDVREATGSQVIFSASNPFAKLDKTNPVIFQNIRLLFNHEPPEPSGVYPDVGPVKTLVYSFPHGYNYVPSTWFLMQNLAETGVGLQPAYQQEGGVIIATDEGFYTAAELHMTADIKNINFYVWKYYDNTDSPIHPYVLGFTLLIRIYVFAGDLTGTIAGS